jgi:predicted metalloprotease with PDZ domain
MNRLWPCHFFALAFAAAALAQIPAPVDEPYPGTISLHVDLSAASQKIFRVHEVIPVKPGTLSLHYPKWIPGEHGPTGTLDGVTGIIVTANSARIPWRRDLMDMFTLQLDVPSGATAIELDFQFLSPAGGANFGASASVTPKLLCLEWNQVAFYPAGHFARQIKIQPSATLPPGWGFATALERESESGGKVQFKPLDFENFVDSPLIAGKNFKRIDLAPGVTPSAHLNLVADRAENLKVTDGQILHHRALVTQALALFGARHYGHYDFLFTLSDNTGHFGLEHHQSSDDRLGAEFFTDPESYLRGAGLLPHEYVHSWNGKYRRPASLTTSNFNVPMKSDLLWVYEGLTEYLGNVLTARAGLWTAEQYRDSLAIVAARMSGVTGRAWRPLQDTNDEAQILYNVSRDWQNWRRSVDFYDEGELIWLDVDTLIRELSGGARSLDDFVRAFHGGNDGSMGVVTYTFDDVAAALNKVQPHDWAAFLRARLDSTNPAAPLGGLARGGWKLGFTDKPTDLFKAGEKSWKETNLMDSLGVEIDAGEGAGTLRDVVWQGPAFEARLAPGLKIIAVNGDKYTAEILKDAITAAKSTTAPIELLVQNGGTFSTVKVNYHGGLRYPRLQRIDATPDRVGDIVKARN